MDRESFLKVLAERFYPSLRAEGFRGSGTTLRRVQAPVIHVVNIQGSTSTDGCYVNLGAHLAFLSREGGGPCVPAKLMEYECAFRDRIEPPPGATLGRWAYGRNAAEAETIVGRLAEEWKRQGHAFFDRYRFPDGFAALVRSATTSPPPPHQAPMYARIADQLGLREEGMTIARQALASVPEHARALRATLTRWLEGTPPA